MGINDWGLPSEDTSDPELSAWAASVAAALNNSDVTVDARIATALKVTHPNVDDVLVQAWDAGKARLQTVYYDSGWRQMPLINGWTGTFGGLMIRRLGPSVWVNATLLNGSAKTSDTLWVPTTGFKLSSAGAGVIALVGMDAVKAIAPFVVFPTKIDCQSTASGVYFLGAYQTADAIPTTLPGTRVAAAPQEG